MADPPPSIPSHWFKPDDEHEADQRKLQESIKDCPPDLTPMTDRSPQERARFEEHLKIRPPTGVLLPSNLRPEYQREYLEMVHGIHTLTDSSGKFEGYSYPADRTPDASINQKAAIEYWSRVTPNVNGMLGGFPQISRIDLQGSANFLTKLRRQSSTLAHYSGAKSSKFDLVPRAVDCGAGIGRITKGFLANVAEVVDIVEPVQKFTDELVKAAIPPSQSGKRIGRVGDIFNLGLQDWCPQPKTYNLIWNQWCLGHLTDVQLAGYLDRCKKGLADGEGWIVIKENMSTDINGEDIFDDEDSSVTRMDEKFRKLFKEAGLKIVATEVQRGFPKDLYPVRMYALVGEK